MDSRDYWELTLLLPCGGLDKMGEGEGGEEYLASGLFNRLHGGSFARRVGK